MWIAFFTSPFLGRTARRTLHAKFGRRKGVQGGKIIVMFSYEYMNFLIYPTRRKGKNISNKP